MNSKTKKLLIFISIAVVVVGIMYFLDSSPTALSDFDSSKPEFMKAKSWDSNQYYDLADKVETYKSKKVITSDALSNTVSTNEIDTTISINDLFSLRKLNSKQRTALSNVKVEGVTIGKISDNGDSVRLQINATKKTTEIINLIGNYFNQKMKEGEDAEIPKNNSVNNQNKDTAGSSGSKNETKKGKADDPCTVICNKLKNPNIAPQKREDLENSAAAHNCPCN